MFPSSQLPISIDPTQLRPELANALNTARTAYALGEPLPDEVMNAQTARYHAAVIEMSRVQPANLSEAAAVLRFAVASMGENHSCSVAELLKQPRASLDLDDLELVLLHNVLGFLSQESRS